jgi:hypothetical protein
MTINRFDLDRIHGVVKKSSRPNYGLHKKESSWYYIYYDKAGKSAFLHLDTNCEMDARRLRNKITAWATAHGRGPKSKLQQRCENILADKENHYGIIYQVRLQGYLVNCKTFEEAKKKQWEIASKIVKGTSK